MAPAHLLLFLIIDLVWGLNFVVAKIGVTMVPPLLFITLRFVMVLVLLAPFLKWQRGAMREIFVVGILAGVLQFSLMYAGTALADASVAAILAQLQLPFATILAILWLKEQVGWRRWLGISLACTGIVILGFDPLIFNFRVGALMIIAACAFTAIAQVYMRRMKHVGVFTLQAWIAAISTVGMLALSLIFEHGQMAAIRAAPLSLWGLVAYTALGATILGQGGMFYLLKRYDVSLVATLTVLAQVFGVIFGVLLLNEPMTWRVAIGGAVICVGVAIIAVRQNRAAAPVTAAAPEAVAVAAMVLPAEESPKEILKAEAK